MCPSFHISRRHPRNVVPYRSSSTSVRREAPSFIPNRSSDKTRTGSRRLCPDVLSDPLPFLRGVPSPTECWGLGPSWRSICPVHPFPVPCDPGPGSTSWVRGPQSPTFSSGLVPVREVSFLLPQTTSVSHPHPPPLRGPIMGCMVRDSYLLRH